MGRCGGFGDSSMKTQSKDGGKAFPGSETIYGPKNFYGSSAAYPDGMATVIHHSGMTLRDWFAGHAMAVMTAAPDYSKGPCNAAIAERAYIIADAMIAEREKVNETPPLLP